MSDELDRLLRESLKSAGDDYEHRQSPQRRAEAREEFLRGYEKRRWAFPFMVAVAATGVAAILAFGVYTVVDRQDPARDDTSEIAGPDAPYETFPVDGDPVDLGVRDNGAWVADAANGRLIHMDPATGDVVGEVEIGGSPSALAIGTGTVWIGDATTGRLYQVDKTSDELIGEPIDVGGPSPSMSISVGTYGVWVVSGGELRMVDLETAEVTLIDSAPEPLDAAANLGSVWVLDGQEGLLRLQALTGERLGEPIPVQGITGDVYAGAEGIWVADRQDDTIVSVDPDTGQTLVIARVRGTYLDLAFGNGAVWVLSRAGGTSGYLTALDPVSGDPMSDPLELGGDPVDIGTGADAVWVALRGEQAIARVDPVSLIQGKVTPSG